MHRLIGAKWFHLSTKRKKGSILHLRAKYVVGTAKELMAKPGGGAKWLALLRDRELPEACTVAVPRGSERGAPAIDERGV